MVIKTHKIRILPNAKMRHILDCDFGYARYCYNQGLEIWNAMYDSYLLNHDKTARPDHNKVRTELVREKEDWQYGYSSRILQRACFNLNRAWQNFFNPSIIHAKQPKFKSKHGSRQSFTTDRAKVSGKHLILDQPRGEHYGQIRITESLRFAGNIKTVTITKHGDKYFASINVEVADDPFNSISGTGINAVDMNIKRLNTRHQTLNTLSKKSLKKYADIKHYNRMLARKRVTNPKHFRSHNYIKVQKKLSQRYVDINNIQQDLINKFSTTVLSHANTIVLENLNVNAMKMNKHIAKNIHRSLFRRTRDMFVYKAEWQHKNVVLASPTYPSTQRCSVCGFIKTKAGYGGKQTLFGDSIHNNHQHYYCYNCGAILDRDQNAVENLIQYAAGLSAVTA